MQQPLKTIRGTLNTQDPSVQEYAHTLAQRIRRSEQHTLRSTAKMLYWLDHPTVQLVHPIEIMEHRLGISSVHPGRTRFLAAVLLNRSYPCVVHTSNERSSIVINTTRLRRLYKPNKAQFMLDRFEQKLEDAYMARAQVLEQEYAGLNAYDFYSRVLGVYCPSA